MVRPPVMTKIDHGIERLEAARRILESGATWKAKYDAIFSEEISGFFKHLFPRFTYYDPDLDHEDDVMAWWRDACEYIGVNENLNLREGS